MREQGSITVVHHLASSFTRAMNTNHDLLADLKASHARSVREARAALARLSASVFNQPQLHDCVRSSGAFQQWQSCSEQARLLEQSIRQMEQGVEGAAQCQA